jgi:hypothetical protein
MNKNEEKQILTGRSTLSLFLVIGLILIVLALQFRGRSSVLQQKEAARIESLAYQVIEVEKRQMTGRGPASIAGRSDENREIGSDPWGRAYAYKYIEIQGRRSLLLWSKGPDGLSQMQAPLEKVPEKSLVQTADDVGIAIPLEQ